MHIHHKSLAVLTTLAATIGAVAQDTLIDTSSLIGSVDNTMTVDTITVAEEMHFDSLADSLLYTAFDVDTVVNMQKLPRQFFLPAVYDTYQIEKNSIDFKPDYSGVEAMRWIEEANEMYNRQQNIMQNVYIYYPDAVKYNLSMLPEAVKRYEVVINPEDYTVSFDEVGDMTVKAPTIKAEEVKKRHWLHVFTANLQFSQAYVSPNWYQGGNNNLNMLIDLNYNIKLNQKFHPTLLFETNLQYKLGLYSTPDDSLRSYNISQDIFQANSTFGIKAIDKWYYTVTGQFKTQLFNSYATNTRNLRSALLSPGELNLGLGMTFNTKSKNDKIKFDASISPLSYNMMICVDNRMNAGSYGIKPGHKTVSKFGSSLEGKLSWKITDNISLASRLFAFTDYHRAYGDLENTVVFVINKYLTTQIFVHMRYDTSTPFVEPGWHKLQIKEILSMGFTYKFGDI